MEKAAARREARLIAKSQTEHRAPMVGTMQEREERAKQQQWAAYQKWQTVHKKELLEGPDGEHFAKLIKFLDQLTIDSAPDLIEAVKDLVWLSDANHKTKLEALRLIDHTIIKLREKEGLPIFDDPLMGEEPNAFMKIRKILTGVGNI